ncbi:ABC transporter permease [Cellulomonas massiliensis]|uniref:ABC transporter permease n=1 Tax=Cellulomonas massiliensis TaxID=1465811 RepID=UPI0002E05D0E|nr:ABC transporter permease [Cellulomonas massiliensis]
MATALTPEPTAPAPVAVAVPERAAWWRRLPVVHQLRQSVGVQRTMLVLGLVLMAVFLLSAIFAPLLAPYGFSQLRDASGEAFGAQQPPSAEHLLGTTVGGYDVLSRVIWGSRTALMVVVIGLLLSVFLGIAFGLVSGYFGGWLDRVAVVVADAVYSFPSLLLAILAAIVISGGQASVWGGIMATAVSITVVFIPQYFRVVRAEVIRVKAEAFVESARVIGTPHRRIMTRHVLRNSTRTLPLIVTLNSSEAILTLAGLGFLGFGIEPTKGADWGYDLNKALSDIAAGIWWTSVWPGVAIVLTVLGITLVGESLNDLADPRLRRRRRAARLAGTVGSTTAVPGGVLAAGAQGADGIDGLEASEQDALDPLEDPVAEPRGVAGTGGDEGGSRS